MSMLLLVLALGAFPAERDVLAPVAGPSPGSTDLWELVARPGGGFYAFYTDDRPLSSIPILRGARLSPALAPLDPAGIPLDLPTNSVASFCAVHDGTALAVAWIHWGQGNSSTVNAQRLSEAGASLSAPQLLATSSRQAGPMQCAFDGSTTCATPTRTSPRSPRRPSSTRSPTTPSQARVWT